MLVDKRASGAEGGEVVPGRTLGTMVTYGFPDIELEAELALARRLGAECLEILPEWSRFPDPGLVRGWLELAEHAGESRVRVCVENMPPGVHPGSRMAELAELLAELNHRQLALTLDTGHANLTADASVETRAAGSLLATTHVHDN